MVRRCPGAAPSGRSTGPVRSRVRDADAHLALELVIDEVVVVGGDVHDRHAIHDALTVHLREALAAASPRAIALASSTRGARRTELQPDSGRPTAEAWARSIAHSIVSALCGGPATGGIAGAGPMPAPSSAPGSPRTGGDR